MKVPVIISYVGGRKYGLVENTSGFILKTLDTEVLANAIKKLILGKDLAQSIGNKGK